MTADQPHPANASGHGPLLSRWVDLSMIFGVTLMAVLGVASITPAFPDIILKFRLTPGTIGLLITAFTLPGVILTPIFGVLADRWGRKKILVPSLFLFGITGSACGFATDFHTLLALRFVQGAGAAALGSLNITIIGDIFSGASRGRVMGYNASVLSVGTAVYPLLGGLLAAIGWNYPFFLPIFAIPLGVAVLFLLQNPEPRNTHRLRDYFRDVARSMDRRALGVFIAAMSTFLILYGSYLTYYPILIGHRFHGSSVRIGIIMAAMSFTTAITASQVGRLILVVKGETLVRIAFLIYGASMAIVPFAPSLAWLMVPTLLFGVAQGINIPTMQTMLAEMAPIEFRAAFMSSFGMVLRLGQTLGPIFSALFYVAAGITGAFTFGALTAAITFVISLLMIRRPEEVPVAQE